MKIKNQLFKGILGVFFIIPLILASCDKDDDNGSPDSNDSGSNKSYEFDGTWKDEGSQYGASWEKFLKIGDGKITKYYVSYSVEGTRIGCNYDTEQITNYDNSADTVSLKSELRDDGTVLTINADSTTLYYEPENGTEEEFDKIEELPSYANTNECDNED